MFSLLYFVVLLNPFRTDAGQQCRCNTLCFRQYDPPTANLPVYSSWVPWTWWSRCSNSCNNGTQFRHRSCNCQNFTKFEKVCKVSEVRACNLGPCPGKEFWSSWSKCSVSCGQSGVQKRSRSCKSSPCSGDNVQIRACRNGICPGHLIWGSWSHWSKCSVSCEWGSQSRSRQCFYYSETKQCLLDGDETRGCSAGPCPVDGKWSSWNNWSACSLTCGSGSQSRNRSCSTPLYYGRNCTGDYLETKVCNNEPCRDSGIWETWRSWNTCSVTCGDGYQIRTRVCSNPTPSCPGTNTQSRRCNINPCPVDGQWEMWQQWSACTLTCGGGTQGRTRTCSNPEPSNGGMDCSGKLSDLRRCNTEPCPVNGQWSNWQNWTPCTLTCDDGTQTRARTCSNPVPAHRGINCLGTNLDSRTCNNEPCPVNGQWSGWEHWSSCTASCDGGTQTRQRTCSNPKPAYSGTYCAGYSNQSQACNTFYCPVAGQWSTWQDWTPCTLTCAGGKQTRTRTCSEPAPAHGGTDCLGANLDSKTCNNESCPEDGQWGRWGSWSTCTATCGGGTHIRQRSCSNPIPANGGNGCVGPNSQQQGCNKSKCPGRQINTATGKEQHREDVTNIPENTEMTTVTELYISTETNYEQTSGVPASGVRGVLKDTDEVTRYLVLSVSVCTTVVIVMMAVVSVKGYLQSRLKCETCNEDNTATISIEEK